MILWRKWGDVQREDLTRGTEDNLVYPARVTYREDECGWIQEPGLMRTGLLRMQVVMGDKVLPYLRWFLERQFNFSRRRLRLTLFLCHLPSQL